MYENKDVIKYIKTLGNPIGRLGPYNIRRVKRKMRVSGVCKDYHYSEARKDIERLERFGAAGCVAKAVNSNMVLKVIWGEHLNSKRKRYHSIFNEITKSVYRYVVNSEFGIRNAECFAAEPQLMRNAECGVRNVSPAEPARTNQKAFGIRKKEFRFSGERVRIVPGGDFIANAEVYYYKGYIIVKPAEGEVWDGAAAVVVYYDTKGNEKCIRLAGSKCKLRNAELWRKERVREERRRIEFARGVIERCRKWLEGVMMWNEAGIFAAGRQIYNSEVGGRKSECFAGGAGEEEIRRELGSLVWEGETGEHGSRRYLNKLLKEVKEYLHRDYMPDAFELEEIEEALIKEEQEIISEHFKAKGIYEQQVKRERKYMKRLMGAVSADLTLYKDGTYRAYLGEEGMKLEERFKKFSVYVTCYVKDTQGFAWTYSETIMTSGKIFDEARARRILSILIALSIAQYAKKPGVVRRE